jgi:hypothetical protein
MVRDVDWDDGSVNCLMRGECRLQLCCVREDDKRGDAQLTDGGKSFGWPIMGKTGG